jgi:YD repeat-containing protein
LTEVAYQTNVSGTWTTQQATTFTYSAARLASTTYGTTVSEYYYYDDNGMMYEVADPYGDAVVSFRYLEGYIGGLNVTPVVQVQTPRGSVGFDYGSTRSGCPSGGGTMVYFNQASTTSCGSDADCGTGNMCGAPGTATGGVCYQAGRCLQLGSDGSSAETIVTSVTPVGASGSGACTGACAEVMQHVWPSSSSTVLSEVSEEDAEGRYTSFSYNSNGTTSAITYGAYGTSTGGTGSGQRNVFLLYDTTYPGRLKEYRRQSNLSSALCDGGSDTTGCARTVYNYNASAPYLLGSVEEIGFTQNGSGSAVPYTYTTSYSYDSLGRVTEVDGPLSGAKTTYSYSSSSSPSLYGYLSTTDTYTAGSAYLTQSISTRDAFGNPTTTIETDGTPSCQTYDSNRNYLTQSRKPMAGQTDCTTASGSDITTNWTRDYTLRLFELQRPDGGCVFYTYDSLSRLSEVWRHDDCSFYSSGDYEEYTYSADSLVTEIDTYTGSGTLTRKQPFTYYQGRQLQEIVNPVNTTYYTGLKYDASGLVTEIDGADSLGKETLSYGPFNQTRVNNDTKYYSSTGSDSWAMLFDFDGQQSQYTDEGSASVMTTLDDLNREVTRTTVDSGSAYMTYDAAGNLLTKLDADGITSTWTYDLMNRRLTVTYAGSADQCNGSATTTWAYDALPSGVSYPSGMTGSNVGGRLAYVNTVLMCSSGSGSIDGAIYQNTFYTYDANGRVTEEYISDGTGQRRNCIPGTKTANWPR